MTLIPNFVALGTLRSVALACVASALIFSPGQTWAQSSDSSSSSSSTSGSSSTTTSTPASGTATGTAASGGPTDQTMDSPSGEARVPPPTSLSTGQPLWSAISPLRLGRLSLLSASFVDIYDTNYNLAQGSGSGSNVEEFSGLVAYSIRKNRSSLDLQWQPSFWYANSTFSRNLAGNLLSFQTSYAFSARTSMTLVDRFSYIPRLSPLSSGGLSANYTNFLLLLNPYLATGTKQIINNMGVTVEHIIDGQNRLTFVISQDFVRLSEPPITPKPQIICLPGLPFCFIKPGPPPKGPILQERPTISAGVTLTHQADARNTYKLIYNIDREFLRGTFEEDTLYHHIGLGYDRALTDRTSLRLEAGPTIAQARSLPQRVVTTSVNATGSASLFHAFQEGGVALSVSRSYDFSGQFSDSANTRVDGTINRNVGKKWEFSGGASYVRQEYSFASPSNGTTEFARASYKLTRSVSFFTGYYYIHFGGTSQALAPRHSISGGVTWSWSPDMNKY
ncbi:MAG TPA: hypothetical protein VE994_21940 [Terriglobales bacterium]|nr:hypothetical protein [Terriglobales bacterium]